MQSLIPEISSPKDQQVASIFNMLQAPLSNVPFHANTKSIIRYFAESFPVHVAVHEVTPVFTPPLEYTQPHLHDEYDEINIIISQKNLLYKIQLDTNEYTVSNNSCIYIPRGMIHAANVLKGSGFFITMRMN